ncbi:MAG TPA: FKBP-type peptidyl-prolyl cis-trans isomerase [Solirubrobacterales bacterium]|nr:FKBP-type peptidyl-prolyl cis-trans isomerase [Solirubrobacterales bacterium]
MKTSAAVICVALALVCVGCGESESATSSKEPLSVAGSPREYQAYGPFATVAIGMGDATPEVKPPDRSPPGKTQIRDLEIGTGPVARRGDIVAVYYVGINYETGKRQYGYWPPDKPTRTQLTFATENKTWEEGIEGMKVGGLREMIIPSHLLFGTGTIDYVLKLVRGEPARNPNA